jgi:hypothetical protein
MTATEIAQAVLAANKVTDADPKAIQVLSQGILASLRNHDGKGVQRTNEGSPARWQLTGKEKPAD